jgi:hypothetical protein
MGGRHDCRTGELESPGISVNGHDTRSRRQSKASIGVVSVKEKKKTPMMLAWMHARTYARSCPVVAAAMHPNLGAGAVPSQRQQRGIEASSLSSLVETGTYCHRYSASLPVKLSPSGHRLSARCNPPCRFSLTRRRHLAIDDLCDSA